MYFKTDDFNIYYEKYGNGKKNILILPGWGNTRKTFDFMISHLEKKYTVYIVDYPGFGNSMFGDRDLTIYDYADLIKDFILDNDLKDLIIISHSFGCRIAILLNSMLGVNIRKLVIIDGAGIKPKKTLKARIKTRIYKILKKWNILFPKKWRKKYLEKLLNIFASSDYKTLKENERKTFSNIVSSDLKDYLEKMKAETLIIWGEKDKDTPLNDAYMMNSKIKGSGLVIFKDASHFSYLDYPYQTNNILDVFLGK